MKIGLLTVFKYVITTIAILLGLLACLTSMSGGVQIIFLLFSSVIIYKLVPRRWGMLGYSVAVIIASLYLFSLFLAVLFMQPLFCLMSSVLSLTAVAVLFKGKPVWLKIVVISIFLVFGAFYLFYNNIVGPMSFQIADMPFDMPGQWHHSYRFFWVGIYVESVCFIASTISVLILLLYSYWPKIKSFPRKFWEIWCS